MMGMFVLCFVIGAFAGYAWGHHDGRIEESGRRIYRHEVDDHRFMDMYHMYTENDKRLTAERDYYKRIAKKKYS